MRPCPWHTSLFRMLLTVHVVDRVHGVGPIAETYQELSQKRRERCDFGLVEVSYEPPFVVEMCFYSIVDSCESFGRQLNEQAAPVVRVG